MKKKHVIILLVAAAVLVACGIVAASLSACGDEESTLPPVASGSVVVTSNSSMPTDVEPDLNGYITRISYSAESTEILVEYLGNDDSYSLAYKTAKITVDSKTAVAANDNSEVTLAVGMNVDVWVGSASGESIPVIAYGQAVLVNKNAAAVWHVTGMPLLTVSNGSNSSYLAVAKSALWNGKPRDFGDTNERLATILGSRMSAAAGDHVVLGFSSKPDECSASYYSEDESEPVALEVVEGGIILPDMSGQYVVCVDAKWSSGTVSYCFSVAAITN